MTCDPTGGRQAVTNNTCMQRGKPQVNNTHH